MRRTATVLVAASLLIAAGCGDDEDDGDDSSADAVSTEALDGRTFLSTEVIGQTLVENTRISMTFEGTNLAVVAGCNTMTGGYTLESDTLTAANLAMTRMGCPDDLAAQDQWIAEFLAAGSTATLDGDDLTLAGDGTTIELTDGAGSASALSPKVWTIDTLEVGGTTLTAPDGASLSYDGESISVSTGCNQAFGAVEVTDDTVTIGQLGSTLMFCDGELGAWETALLAFLQGELTYEVTDTQLTLTSPAGTLTLTQIP